jgi:hypothetical protein
MKKFCTITLCIALTLFSTAAFSQHYEPHFSQKGTSFLSFGIGLFPTFFKDNAQVIIPPSSLQFEKKLTDIFSIGIMSGYSRNQTTRNLIKNNETKQYLNDSYFLGLRSGAHCLNLDKWDFYGGVMLGYYHARVHPSDGRFGPDEEFMGIRPQRGQFVWNAYVGTRFSCCNRLIFFGEASYGISIFTIGLGLKLN